MVKILKVEFMKFQMNPMTVCLSPQESKRYAEKLSYIDGQDPYSIPKESLSDDPTILPSVTYPDIVNYLVFNSSAYTKEDLKAYKGLQAYIQFECGWVQEIVSLSASNGNCLVKAKVWYDNLFFFIS